MAIVPSAIHFLFAISHYTIRSVTYRFLYAITHGDRLNTDSHSTCLTVTVMPFTIYLLFTIHHSTCDRMEIIPLLIYFLFAIKNRSISTIAHSFLTTVFSCYRLKAGLHHTCRWFKIMPFAVNFLLSIHHSTCNRMKIIPFLIYFLLTVKNGSICSITYFLCTAILGWYCLKAGLHHTLFVKIVPFTLYLLLTDRLIAIFIIIISLALFSLPSNLLFRLLNFLICRISTYNWHFIILSAKYSQPYLRIACSLIFFRHIGFR